LVEIEVDGVVGIGESWVYYPAWSHRERVATLIDGLAHLVLGHDVSDPGAVHQRLVEDLTPLGRQWGAPGPIWQAISGVDLALWDLKGKIEGRSVAQLLSQGPLRASVPAYGSGVGPDDVVQLTEAALDLGLEAVKVKLGFGSTTDLVTLALAKDVLGPSAELFADANQGWALSEALEMTGVLAEFDVGWIEEPVAGDRLSDLERLAHAGCVPVATGENVYGPSTFDRYVRSSAVAVIQPDVAKCGGITAARRVCASVDGEVTTVAPHCYGSAVGIAASVQLAAAFPTVRWVELDVRDNPLRTDLLAPALQVQDGCLVMPEGPGLGVQLDQQVVARFTTHTEERVH
jgi:L-alanine-DL-glutamate epimerase-like enolase superfamily enzyme